MNVKLANVNASVVPTEAKVAVLLLLVTQENAVDLRSFGVGYNNNNNNNNKHQSAEGEQHTFKNKLKEDLQIMWHKVRLLQMSEREKLPKLKTNSKLIKLQGEINGVREELLEKDEMNITNINNFIYAAATIMTQKLNEPSKRSKSRRDVKFWKIRMQKQISSWRKSYQ